MYEFDRPSPEGLYCHGPPKSIVQNEDNGKGRKRLDQLLSQSPDFREFMRKNSRESMGANSNAKGMFCVDDATIPRKLRQSGSVDIGEALTLDLKNESKVS